MTMISNHGSVSTWLHFKRRKLLYFVKSTYYEAWHGSASIDTVWFQPYRLDTVCKNILNKCSNKVHFMDHKTHWKARIVEQFEYIQGQTALFSLINYVFRNYWACLILFGKNLLATIDLLPPLYGIKEFIIGHSSPLEVTLCVYPTKNTLPSVWVKHPYIESKNQPFSFKSLELVAIWI